MWHGTRRIVAQKEGTTSFMKDTGVPYVTTSSLVSINQGSFGKGFSGEGGQEAAASGGIKRPWFVSPFYVGE